MVDALERERVRERDPAIRRDGGTRPVDPRAGAVGRERVRPPPRAQAPVDVGLGLQRRRRLRPRSGRRCSASGEPAEVHRPREVHRPEGSAGALRHCGAGRSDGQPAGAQTNRKQGNEESPRPHLLPLSEDGRPRRRLRSWWWPLRGLPAALRPGHSVPGGANHHAWFGGGQPPATGNGRRPAAEGWSYSSEDVIDPPRARSASSRVIVPTGIGSTSPSSRACSRWRASQYSGMASGLILTWMFR